jgi:hypothetical protein
MVGLSPPISLWRSAGSKLCSMEQFADCSGHMLWGAGGNALQHLGKKLHTYNEDPHE